MATPSSQSDSSSVTPPGEAVISNDTVPTSAISPAPGADKPDDTKPSVPPTVDEKQLLEASTGAAPPHPLQPYGAILAIYGLFAAIDLLTVGFQSILGPQAADLLTLAANPWLGLLLGILATALVQSSSIVTTLLVTLVAGGLPLGTAIPMVMGANLGTTITNTLVSLGYIGNDQEFERGFAAATVHDCFNLCALLIFFPLELLAHPLEHLSQWLVTHGPAIAIPNGFSPLAWLLQPVRWTMASAVNALPGPWDSLLLFGVSVGGLMVAVTTLARILKNNLGELAKARIRTVFGRGSGLGIATGTGITALLQSSSMTTGLVVPMAAAGVVTLADIYPFVLGANIGTCVTALLATLALQNTIALQLALVHLSYNLLAVMVVYGIPVLRPWPLTLAETVSALALKYRVAAIAYVAGIFFVLPLLVLWLSVVLMTSA